MTMEFLKGRLAHIIHLEDDPLDREWVAATLARAGLNLDLVQVDNHEAFLKALARQQPDIIISDYSIPGYDGVQALNLAKARQITAPFIFFSGTMGEDAAIESLTNGATDYVLKQHPERLIAAVRRALAEAQERAARLEAEEKIREQAALLDEARDAICVNDLDQSVLFWNKSAERLYGWSRDEAIGRNANELLLQTEVALTAMKTLISQGEWQGELRQTTRAGQQIIVQSRWSLIRDPRGLPKSILIINTDITEKKQMEERFLRTQRMENLGALASGIAHDLNNILTPIIMAAEIVCEDPENKSRDELLETIQISARRGSEMVNQILSFTRGVTGEMVPVPIQHIVKEIIKLIGETIPRSITLKSDLSPHLPSILADATQLHQVLLNLCVNARDAMPEGGTLTIRASQILFERRQTAMQPVPVSGPFIALEVSDTGTGISPALQEQIFEPFFTTKEPGKGTGIGLSTVSNIVKNHGGFLELSSEIDCGTTFRLYFPVAKTVRVAGKKGQAAGLPSGNGEWILVVEDESAIIEIIRSTLQAYNYRVLTARNGLEAVKVFTQNYEKVDLVMMDMMMPGLSATQLLEALREVSSAVKIIAVSGQLDHLGFMEKNAGNVKAFLNKPFTISKLLATLQSTLHA
jgi:PAS domain S-box-containing protein